MITASPAISSIVHVSHRQNYCPPIADRSCFRNVRTAFPGFCHISFPCGSLSLHSRSSKPSSSPAATPSWVDVYLPEPVRPYAQLARVEKPIGIWLVAWPSMWAISLAASPGGLPDPMMLALFFYGASVLRAASCTVNDFIDRDLDAHVERTKSRPLACGALTPYEALKFLALEVFLYLGSFFPLNDYSRALGVLNLLILCIYPLMKRVTYWPQAVLGVGINMGVLTAWSAIKGNLDLPIVLPLYISSICWTLVYDTIYAHQDKNDDIKVGIKSTALRFGGQTKLWISGFGIACVGGLALSGYNAQLEWPFYALLAAAAGHLSWQILSLDLSDPTDCNSKFVSNQYFGAIVFAGFLLGRQLVGTG